MCIFSNKLHKDSSYGPFLLCLIAFKDISLPIVLIYFPDVPLIQIIYFIIVCILQLGLILSLRPFPNLLSIIIYTFNQILFLLILVTFIGIYFVGDTMSANKKNGGFGYFIMGILGLIMIGNIIYCFIETVTSIIEIIKWIGKPKVE